jgi:hypothetical protein
MTQETETLLPKRKPGRQRVAKWHIVRTHSAGVFFGQIVSRNGREVELLFARRIWYWAGAASLSQLAQEGTKEPLKCKFPCVVDRILLLDAVEILDTTEAAQKSIMEVPVWQATSST